MLNARNLCNIFIFIQILITEHISVQKDSLFLFKKITSLQDSRFNSNHNTFGNTFLDLVSYIALNENLVTH